MAWYLSEIITDLSPIRDILKLYHQTESFNEGEFHREYQSRLVPLLRQSHFNSDHIDTDTIPAKYENDEYKWLASGYHDLIFTLGLIKQHYEKNDHRYGYELTDLGTQVLNQTISIAEFMKRKLPEWKNDHGIYPYTEILKIISELKRVNLYPCDGLMLLEVLIILLWLNIPHGYINPYNQIYQKRKAYYAHMVGEPRIDLIQYSDFLWEELSQDLSNYFAANYPTRSTLQLMMYAGELTYGQVPDEVFGHIQYITSS